MDTPSLRQLLNPDLDRVRWDELQTFSWVKRMKNCPQDPVHHAEGDVWIHTRMVLEELTRLKSWREMPESDRYIVHVACLLHDVAKPFTTVTEPDGRVTANGHSRAGELVARQLLWNMGVPFAHREQICALIRFHQVPFFLIERDDCDRVAAEISLRGRCDLLGVVAEADIRGRVCQDLNRVLDNIGLYNEYCLEQACYSNQKAFASAHTRIRYFENNSQLADVEAYDDCRGQMTIMCGLPGAGKDHFIKNHLGDIPMISLDGLREEMDVSPTDEQGAVVQAAKEKARTYLRKAEPFVWNATNLTRQRRSALIGLARDYHARVKIVYVESPREKLFEQNRSRKAVVPPEVIERMTSRWEVPTLTEAHEVQYVVRD